METIPKFKEKPNEKFREAFLSVSRYKNKHTEVKERIIKECKTTKFIFNNWLLQKSKIPKLAEPIIAEILDKTEDELFN